MAVWRQENPSHMPSKDTYSIYSETGERKRKRHQKSSNGCEFCKRRRIKCSEDWPSCSNCSRLRKVCQYQSHKLALSPNRHSPMHDPTADLALLLPTMQVHLCAALAATDDLDADLIGYSPLIRKYALKCLDHFFRCDRAWLKHPQMQAVMQQNTSSHEVLGQSYLLHAALAVSAAHLALLLDVPQYRTLSLVLWQKSLRAYTPCLLDDLRFQNIDTLFWTSHLLSMLAAANERCQIPPHGLDEDRLPESRLWETPKWILSLRGIKALWDVPNVIPRLSKGIWGSWVQENADGYQEVLNRLAAPKQSASSPTLRALRKYCSSFSTTQRKLYQGRIAVLEILERCDRSPGAGNLLSWFVTRAPQEYISHLQRNDEMALLLLMYWLRIASRLGQWWLAVAAKTEFDRLSAYVSERCVEETSRTILMMMKDD